MLLEFYSSQKAEKLDKASGVELALSFARSGFFGVRLPYCRLFAHDFALMKFVSWVLRLQCMAEFVGAREILKIFYLGLNSRALLRMFATRAFFASFMANRAFKGAFLPNIASIGYGLNGGFSIASGGACRFRVL